MRAQASHFTPIARRSEISLELMNLVAAIRDAEEVFDTLDNHTDPVRRELVELLTRLRKNENQDFRNTLPAHYHRSRLHLTIDELRTLTTCRAGLYKTVTAQKVRQIVDTARGRYPNEDSANLPARPIHLAFTEDEMLDLADCWATLPNDFADKLKEVKTIRDAVKSRQTVQSGFAMVRAAKALVAAVRNEPKKPLRDRRFTDQEIEWAHDCGQRLHASDSARLADATFQQAWKRYNDELPSKHPFGLLLSEEDLSTLTEWRDDLMIKFESELHQLRVMWNQPISEMQVIKPKPRIQGSPLICSLRFDGTQTTTTLQLSGLQFWSEFSLETYQLPLPFNVIVK